MTSLKFDARKVAPAVAKEAPTAPAFTPSKYQAAIFEFIEHGTGNGIVRAVAGSGKTTTIVRALGLTHGNAIFLAFNKSIADELKTRVPEHVQARTFHSLCYSPVLRAVGAKAVNANKLREITREEWGDELLKKYGAFAIKLVGLARSIGIGCLVPDTEAAWADLVDTHCLTLDTEDADIGEGIVCARELLSDSNASKEVDFDDLLYQAVRLGIKLPTFDWVFVDEAQDTNAIQRALLRKIMAPNARLVAVGDPAQAIYGFRGADAQSMQRIADEFKAVSLPLSVSYRCAQSIVKFAQGFVPEIEYHGSAPEGKVTNLGTKWTSAIFEQDDLIVCRTTKPLLSLAFGLLRQRIPCRILGRDIGEGLIALIRRMKGRDLDDMLARLEKWRDREMQKAIAKGEDALAEQIEDRAGAITMLAASLPEDERSIDSLTKVLSDLFAQGDTPKLTLCTVHKAKGLEANRVFWLNRSACPSRWARQDWQRVQENNLMYVAITRAKRELVIIEEEGK